MRDGSPAQICSESVPTTILGKARVVTSRPLSESCNLSTSSLGIMRATFGPASVGQSYSADSTTSLFTSHGHQKDQEYFAHPSFNFVFYPGEEATPQPPIWSVLIYMLLVERHDVDDEALRQRLGVVIPSRDPSPLDLGLKTDVGGRKSSERLELEESQSFSGALSEVRILFFLHFHYSRLRRT